MNSAAEIAEKEVIKLTSQVQQLRRDADQKDQALKETEQSLKDKDQVLKENKQFLKENELRIKAHEDRLSQYEKRMAGYEKIIKLYEEAERLAKLQRFGQSSEKSKFQIDFFDEAELEEALSELEDQIDEEEPEPLKKKSPRKKREGLSPNLPRVRVELTLTEEEKAGAINTFFSKVKETLDIIPAQVQVIEYWQEKAVFGDEFGENKIVAAQREAQPLGKCIASIGLLAYIIVSKYADALPLYRLEKILKRYGGAISRTTMANWIIRLDDVFKPLIQRLQTHQLGADYLQADETRLQVLKEAGKVATSDKWMWLIRGGPPDKPVVLFHYDASRSEAVPTRLLDGFSGVLQTDGYAGYNAVCRLNGLTRLGCWDHARRKFMDASKTAPAKKKNSKGSHVSKADVALSQIRKLYRIEEKIKSLDVTEKTQQRQRLSKPLLEDFKAWLDKNLSKVPKNSLTYKAIFYTLNQWEYLIGYAEDGQLNISNALAENAIRPFAIGRKNWLFSDTSRGAKASATCYSLIETAKANGLEPYQYLRHVLQHIAAAKTDESIEALLPWNVALADSVNHR